MQPANITLRKFKKTATGATITYQERYEIPNDTGKVQWSEPVDVTKELPFTMPEPLIAALQGLVPHMLLRCEFVRGNFLNKAADLLDDDDLTEPFSVTGFIVKEKGYMFIGRRRLDDGRILNIISPFFAFEVSEGMLTYRFDIELGKALDEATTQALLYMEGSHGFKGAQLELDFSTSEQQAAS